MCCFCVSFASFAKISFFFFFFLLFFFFRLEVVTVWNNPMTPIPCHNSDDSSKGKSDATEGEDEQGMFSMCYESNE
jgi:hypothetical protein